MEETGFVKYKTVIDILEKASFFGFTVRKEEGGRRIVYKFRSVKWFKTTIEITTLKLEPNKINSAKIVLNISINGENVENIEDFKSRLEGLGKKHGKKGK